MPRIEGTIRATGGFVGVTRATVRLRVDDVSRVGAAASTIARKDFPFPVGTGVVSYSIELPDGLDTHLDYSLSVHIDCGGSGSVKQGDFVTMQSYPIVAAQTIQRLDVVVNSV